MNDRSLTKMLGEYFRRENELGAYEECTVLYNGKSRMSVRMPNAGDSKRSVYVGPHKLRMHPVEVIRAMLKISPQSPILISLESYAKEQGSPEPKLGKYIWNDNDKLHPFLKEKPPLAVDSTFLDDKDVLNAYFSFIVEDKPVDTFIKTRKEWNSKIHKLEDIYLLGTNKEILDQAKHIDDLFKKGINDITQFL